MLDPSEPRWQLASFVLGRWKDTATREAQRLIRLNEEAARREIQWAEEKKEWTLYKTGVQVSMRRGAREAALGGRQSPGKASKMAHAAEEVKQARADLHDMQQLLQRAAANVTGLKQDRAILEEELRRRHHAVEFNQSRIRALQTVAP